jgi:ribosomal protein L7Ae-like RNA K-turn-binding protein
MVNTACAKGLFRRQAGREVKIPADFAGLVDGLMVRRCLDLIGLARRAGKVVAGFKKVQARLRGRNDNDGGDNNGGDVLLQAGDGAGGGRDKIKALAPGIRSVDVFKARELGRAIGRDQAVHVVMAGGKLAESLIREANRLMAFRGPDR